MQNSDKLNIDQPRGLTGSANQKICSTEEHCNIMCVNLTARHFQTTSIKTISLPLYFTSILIRMCACTY